MNRTHSFLGPFLEKYISIVNGLREKEIGEKWSTEKLQMERVRARCDQSDFQICRFMHFEILMIDLLRADLGYTLASWIITFGLHLDGEIHSKWTFDDAN